MNNNNLLIIIPAKGSSQRVPNKNMQLIGGIPLFLHSIKYAFSEGFSNVIVSSDNDEILSTASQNGCLTFKETVDESKMENCINQVINQYPNFDYIAILQPTSPIRKSGLLNNMIKTLHSNNKNSIVTCQKIKPVAWYKGECMFNIDRRPLSQDKQDFIYHFDGSICIVKMNNYKKDRILIHKDALIEVNPFPYYLQIDTQEELELIKYYIELKTKII